jgi:hypothetical protein
MTSCVVTSGGGKTPKTSVFGDTLLTGYQKPRLLTPLSPLTSGKGEMRKAITGLERRSIFLLKICWGHFLLLGPPATNLFSSIVLTVARPGHVMMG